MRITSRFALAPILFFALAAALSAQTQPLQPTGCAAMLEKWKSIAVLSVENWRWHSADGVHGEEMDLDNAGWTKVEKGQKFEPGSYWFRAWVEVPSARGGYEWNGARMDLELNFRSQDSLHKTVYVNGLQRALGEEFEPVVLTTKAEAGQKFLIAVKAQAAAGQITFRGGQVRLISVPDRPDPIRFFEECYGAERLNEAVAPADAARSQTIEAARNAVDWTALERGDQKRFDESLVAARAKLDVLRPWMKHYEVFAAGNAHIDMAWLWPWTETVEVTRNTFSSVLKLMNEFPDLHFTHASMRTYAWMEEKYPALFEQVKRRVKEGRWEVVGGMWVEPDLNLPDGESLVRQLLIGTRYAKEKLGVDVRIGWNPDSFGYNWQLPQIYKRSGLDYFVTQKIYWNDTTKFPYKLFWWEAPDGSRVLTYFPNDYVNSMDPLKLSRDTSDAVKKSKLPEMLHLYGIGDHGGGPTRRMLEDARVWQKPEAIFPSVTLSSVQNFFDTVAKKLDPVDVPVWKDELYLEYHRGTYTTQAETKRNNRKNEVLMLNAEKFASIASLFGQPYPQQELNDAWRLVLFNQFHDILPGSGIAPVYVDAARDQDVVRRIAASALSASLEEVVSRIDVQVRGVPIVVFNPLPWTRTEIAEVTVRGPVPSGELAVFDGSGTPISAEFVKGPQDSQPLTVRFLAQSVPGVGYSIFWIAQAPKLQRRKGLAEGPYKIKTWFTGRGHFENGLVSVSISTVTGCITSLVDMRSRREVLAPNTCANLLQAFRDKPKDWDAWNIDSTFEEEKWNLDKAEDVTLVEKGPPRATIRIVKRFQRSTLTQYVSIYLNVPRVDIRTEADWHEDHILLKAAFPINAKSDFATFEIPYGSIQRPTTRNTPAEKAKFEVPALRWADLGDANGGLSVLNDCKYGYDAKDNVLRISLLRSPKWPDPNADMGHHEFTYSLYPHAGSWKDAGTMRAGYELNNPLIAVVTQPHPGSLPPSHSFLEVAPENVVLTAVKKAEDNDSLLLRYYEFAGKETQVRITLPAGAVRAWETNLMEKDENELRIENGAVIVPTRPYQIKTVRVEFKK